MESISISNCDSLLLNLSLSGNLTQDLFLQTRFDIELESIDSLELFLKDSDSFVRNIFMDNVRYVEAIFEKPEEQDALQRVAIEDNPEETDDEDDDTTAIVTDSTDAEPLFMTTEELYFWIIIGLSALLTVTWICIPIVCYCVCKKGRGCCCGPRRNKRVSRADSWRYESNIYVNPNSRQARQKINGNQPVKEYNTEAAFHQMLPFQLVPQREATLISHSPPPFAPEEVLKQHLQEEISYESTGNRGREGYEQMQPQSGNPGRRFFDPSATIESNQSCQNGGGGGGGGQYTDTSLQYADDESEDGNPAEGRSNANSASYGSRNQSSTLPLQQSGNVARR